MPILPKCIATVIGAACALICITARWDSYLELESDPDTVEYAAGAVSIANGTGCNIRINSDTYPPRYPPWFSLLLAPAVKLFGGLGGAILMMAAAAGLCLYTAFKCGYTSGGTSGGMLAAALLASLPIYRNFSCNIMTEVPFLLAVLLLLGIHTGAAAKGGYTLRSSVSYGICSALAAGFKPIAVLLVAPALLRILRNSNGRWKNLGGLLIPPLLMIASTAAYNHATFGSIGRNGYNYWCAIPFDFPELVFSASYLKCNIITVFSSLFIMSAAAFLILALIWVWYRKRTLAEHRASLEFIILGVCLYSSPYLVYFYTDDRFFMALAVVSAVTAAGIIPGMLPDKGRSAVMCISASILAAALYMLGTGGPKDFPRRNAVNNILSGTTDNSIVFSSLNPALLSFFAGRDSGRIFIPVSRNVEYASKAVSLKKLTHTTPDISSALDHRQHWIFSQGAKDVFPSVLLENRTLASDHIRAGKKTFICTELMHPADAAQLPSLTNSYIFIQTAPMLYELLPRRTD